MKLNQIICGDTTKILPTFPSESIDLVVTDPPYNSQISWDKKDNNFQFEWLNEIKRILKPGGSLYVFFAPLNSYGIEGFIRENFTLQNKIVWYHANLYGAGLSYGNSRYKSTWDEVFYAVKGDKAKHNKKVAQESYVYFKSGFDVVIEPQPRPLLHKAQKPLKMIERFIWCSSNEGDVVLDPFCGSGTTLVGAEKLNRKWIGIDNMKESCEIAKKRINFVMRQRRI